MKSGEKMLFPYGNNIKLYTSGGSHDEKIELILKGFPEGVKIDEDFLLSFMKRRAPGEGTWSTERKEADIPVFLSGIKDGSTTGEDILCVIYNQSHRSTDYSTVNRIPRPSHADFPAIMKYGSDTDLRGGGHYSGRLTSLICVAGALSMMYLKEKGIDVIGHIYSIENICDTPFDLINVGEKEKKAVLSTTFPTINKNKGEQMQKLIVDIKKELDSLGGIVECAVTGLPAGLGEHMFAGVEGRISSMMFSVPAVKGIEFGKGFSMTKARGSENNDPYYYDNDTVKTKTNNQGGISGGMTNGMPVIFRVAIKPTPSIGLEQESVDLEEKKDVRFTIKGRHDPCIVPRAVPVTEAAAAVAILDILLDEVNSNEQ